MRRPRLPKRRRRGVPDPWTLEVFKVGRARSGRLRRGDDFVALIWGRNRRELNSRAAIVRAAMEES